MIDTRIPLRDGLPTQSLRPTLLKHLVVDGTDVAICTPMHVANFNQLTTNTPIEFCPACRRILRERSEEISQKLQGS
jgi:hypothetical protein